MNVGVSELLIILLFVGGPLLVVVIALVAVKTARGNQVPDQVWPAPPLPGAPPVAPPGDGADDWTTQPPADPPAPA